MNLRNAMKKILKNIIMYCVVKNIQKKKKEMSVKKMRIVLVPVNLIKSVLQLKFQLKNLSKDEIKKNINVSIWFKRIDIYTFCTLW